jgi:broad specificity phosphatase PhoE
MRIFLVRHGQTAWNAERRVLGRTDIPLDTLGRSQAAALAGVLPTPDAVYTSPLRRARETAAALSPTAIAVADLVEMDQGALEGLDATELAARHGPLVEAWREDPGAITLPDGESMHDLQRRGRSALAAIAADARRELRGAARIAVVTHQLWLSAVLCDLAGDPLRRWRAWSHRNTAWAELEWFDGIGRVVTHDVAPHLDRT